MHLGLDLISYLLKTWTGCTMLETHRTQSREGERVRFRTLTPRRCLPQSPDGPGSALTPGKCSLRAGTSVLAYCGQSQGCVVSTELFWR